MRSAAIVLAGGIGSRMMANVPKQYMLLNDYPILYYSIKAFEDSAVDDIIVVTSEADLSYCKEEIINKYGFHKVKKIVVGGNERYDSVYNGIQALEDVDYVMIHDGARPLITQSVIAELLSVVQEEGACVAAVPVKDTIKVSDEYCYAKATLDRRTLWQIQTPQVFYYPLIRDAYSKIYSKEAEGISITDDAMVVETFTNQKVKLVEGEYSNIKITTPEDMYLAKALLDR